MQTLPVIIIGAGPVGLAAAAHLLERGLEPLLLEAGDRVGAHLRQWSHVRMFSPWEFNTDAAARRLLARHGWAEPEPGAFPTGGELAGRYLEPLASTPEIAARLRTGARVTGVSRHRLDRMKDAGRRDTPFLVRYEDASGEHELLARAVIDASGTWGHPNPLGSSGLPARGETAAAANIAYGIPDVTGAARGRYAGRRVLVVGSGHSAFNVLKDLARLADEAPGTTITWALRRTSLRRVLGGGDNDQLRERGRLGQEIARLVDSGALVVATGFQLDQLRRTPQGLVAMDGERALAPVDEVIACTGFRPDLGLLSELRLELDPGTQSPRALGPLIDPNLHSCGSVRPHGAEQLGHPDEGLYVVGMKSYGRAPTFLLLTGYEQVRSVVAAIAGDWEAARRVELVLPETGVCITDFGDEGEGAAACCAVPASAPEPAAASCCAAPVPSFEPSAASCCAPPVSAPTPVAASCCATPKPAPQPAPQPALPPKAAGCCAPPPPVRASAPEPVAVRACCG